MHFNIFSVTRYRQRFFK